MRPTTTLIMFVISLTLGVAIWWTDRAPSEEESGQAGSVEPGKVLVRLTPDRLTRLVIKSPAGEAQLEKKDGYWHFNQPIADRADPESMNALIDLLSHLTVLDSIPIDEVGSSAELQPEALGLTGEQVVRIDLTETDEAGPLRSESILIGKATPLANSIYVRIPDSDDHPDIYVVNGNPGKYFEDPVTALRDRHLFLAPADQVVQITVRTPKGEIEMKRKIVPPVADWTLTKPLQTLADRKGIEALLAGLAAIRVESVLASGDLPGPAPRPVPDGSVVLELWRYGVDTPLTLFLSPPKTPSTETDPESKEPPLIEARVSDRPAVFLVRSRLLETLPATPNGFRDPHLARIPPQVVFGIAIESRGNPPVVLKTARTPEGVRWFSQRNGTEEAANEVQIFELIKAINEEEVIAFVSDTADRLAEFNLDPPALQIAISHYERQPETSPDGTAAAGAGQMGIVKKVLSLGFSDNAEDPAAAHKLFANFAGEPFIQELSPAFREKVPTHPLKWKDLKLITFNPISLRSIDRTLTSNPDESVKLAYDYRTDGWTATQGTSDLSDRVNKEAARKLRDTLGSLTAVRWLTPSPHAFQAIETPDATFGVTLEVVDRASGKASPKHYTIRFARSGVHDTEGNDLSYIGRIDDSLDLFEIDRETYRDIIAPILNIRVAAPPQ